LVPRGDSRAACHQHGVDSIVRGHLSHGGVDAGRLVPHDFAGRYAVACRFQKLHDQGPAAIVGHRAGVADRQDRATDAGRGLVTVLLRGRTFVTTHRQWLREVPYFRVRPHVSADFAGRFTVLATPAAIIIESSRCGRSWAPPQLGNLPVEQCIVFRSLRVFLGLMTAWTAPAAARADIFELKDGGAVVGAVVERRESGDYLIQTADGAQIKLERSQLERIVPHDTLADEYDRRSRTTPDTADGHRQLAAWCAERNLRDEADHHLARVADLDPDDEEARRGLGLQRVNGRWLTREQMMATRGMRLHEGKFRTPQDIAVRERDKQQQAIEVDWFSKLRTWRGWLDDRRPDRVAEAQRQIAAINDPQATPALVKLLDDEEDDWVFELLLNAVGRSNHPLAAQTLVAYSLEDGRLEIREQCLDYLLSSNRPVSILPYVQALKDKDNVIVNRAGAALGKLENPAAVSPLIDALVTTHKYQIQGAAPGQIGAAFNPSGGGGGLQMGGNGPQIIQRERENLSVLRALEKLTGAHEFDFDEQAWRRWYVDRQMREHTNARRDE
jgi:hypothetical protein